MKKIIFSLAVVLCMVSCTKDEQPIEKGSTIFTAVINNSQETKTSIDLSNGKVSWVLNDVIKVNGVQYKVKSIKDGVATFEKDDTKEDPESPYTATYGDIDNQVYTGTYGSNCTMSASSSTTQLTFTNDNGAINVKLPSVSGKSVASIKIGDYTLTCTPAVELSEEKSFIVCLPAGKYTQLSVNYSDNTCLPKVIDESVEASKINKIKIKNQSVIALPGTFTINASGNKVRFSAGNLYYDGSVFKFEANQYDYRTWPISGSKNAIINGASVETPSGHTGHMKTRAEKATMVSMAYNDGSVPSSSEDILFAKSTNSEMPGWRMLTGNTNNEWNYLLEKRNTQTLGGTANARWAPVTVCGVIGLIILPDSYTWPDGVAIPAVINNYRGSTAVTSYDSVAFEKLQAAGIVFLPAAGYRNGTTMYNVGEYVNYMGVGLTGINVYHVYLTPWVWQGGTRNDTGNYGRAIRLVTDM